VSVRKKVGDWQAKAVRLKALVDRRRAAGQPVGEITGAAASMLEEIESDRRFLEEQSAILPVEVARHSRFQDVVRALASASAAISAVLRNH